MSYVIIVYWGCVSSMFVLSSWRKQFRFIACFTSIIKEIFF